MAGQFDVSIIGSGTGGETLARHLAPSGKSILLLELYGAALFYFSRGSQPPLGVGEELSGDDAKDAAKRAKNRHVAVTIYKFVD